MNEILIIIAANLLLYFKALKFKFVSDDYSVFRQTEKAVIKNKFDKRLGQLLGRYKFMSDTYRLYWDKGKPKIDKYQSEEQEHLIALILHIILCILIYYAFGANQISFIAALLYGSNPANNQGTTWPGGRGYILPAISLMLAFAVPILALPALFFACWYTVGFYTPLSFIGSEQAYILLFLIPVALFHARKFFRAVKFKHGTESFKEDKTIHPRKLIILFKTYGFYLAHCLVPYRVTFYHNFLQSMAGNVIMKKRAYALDKFFWIGLTVFTAMVIYSCNQWDKLSWAWLAFTLGIFPFCNLFRANQEIAERFTTIPNLFLMYMLAQIITPYPVAIAIFLTYYATRTYHTLNTYKDEYWITEYAVIEDPWAWWAWHCRGMKRWDTKSYNEALILWVMASLISPKEFKVLINIATVLRLLKRNEEADYYLKQAADNIVEGQEEMAYKVLKDHKEGNLPILL